MQHMSEVVEWYEDAMQKVNPSKHTLSIIWNVAIYVMYLYVEQKMSSVFLYSFLSLFYLYVGNCHGSFFTLTPIFVLFKEIVL